jgi:hypothetical protein
MTTFITADERIDMPYWSEGLQGSFAAEAMDQLLCNGEKSCL